MIITEGKTLQQVVNEIAEKLIQQGKPCIKLSSPVTACAYGDNKGNHCAIGWLLPEERDDLMMDGGNVSQLVDYYDDLGPNDDFIRENEVFLFFLQGIHDAVTGACRTLQTVELGWGSQVRLAERAGVDISPLKDFFFMGLE